ncbi:MAG: hypothetical protein AABX98_01985, partial [Nanoarchaeota archaeon]
MVNLRDSIQLQGMHEASVQQILSLLVSSEIEVVREDCVDYFLNVGHSHRTIEGWDTSVYTGETRKVSYAQNHYPEKALVSALGERIIGETFSDEEYITKLKATLRTAYGLDGVKDNAVVRLEKSASI